MTPGSAPDARTAAAGPDPRRRIDDIEVLRGFAILFVLVEHVRLNLLPWVSGDHAALYRRFGFWSGVDLFFAISGFVIARSLLPTLAQAAGAGGFFRAALAFWVRRAWRLLPSAWLWLAIILAAAALFNRSGAFEPFDADFRSVRAAFLNLANLRTVQVLGREPTGAAFPYWSLSLEEQFYLVLPFLVFVARRRLALALTAAVAVQFYLRRTGPDGNLFLNMFRSDALALGVLVALWSGSASWRRVEPVAAGRSGLSRVAAPALLLVVFCAAGAPAVQGLSFGMGLIAALGAALVWLASYDRGYVFPPGRFKRTMCWVGSRSYAIYLTHIPAFFAAREALWRIDPANLDAAAGHALALLGAGVPLALGLAELNYRLVEAPLRRRGVRIADAILRRSATVAGRTGEPSLA